MAQPCMQKAAVERIARAGAVDHAHRVRGNLQGNTVIKRRAAFRTQLAEHQSAAIIQGAQALDRVRGASEAAQFQLTNDQDLNYRSLLTAIS